MNIFDFAKCVVKGGYAYCTDFEGNIYKMPLPEQVDIDGCPKCVIKELLSMRINKRI
jgi:hypothetical protein